jgi:protein-glutamine gamma-glutamyltransferase
MSSAQWLQKPMLSPMQFQYSVAALAAASLPAMLWLAWPISLCLAATLGIRVATARRYPQAWPRALKVALIATFTGLVIANYGNFFGRGPGGALLLLMLALKSTESATTRDARLMVCTSFFVLVASFLMSQSFVALILSALATLVGFAALEVLSRPAVGGPNGSPFKRLGTREVLSLLSLAIPFTLALWLLFPRLATPLWGTSESDNGRSGLSNSMTPSSIAELLVDDSPVMRIRFDNGAHPEPSQLFFRGPVLWDLSSAGTWSTGETRGQLNRPRAASATDLSYEVILEPTDQRMLFVADQAVTVSEEQVLFTSEQRFLRTAPIADLLRYRARSALSDQVPPGRYEEQEKRWALRLPADRNPRSVALGQQLAAQHQSPTAIVNAALAIYRDQPFRYTLSPPEALGIHTTDEFLFDNRAGFCQHYANSFATLMRAAGVPTRVTTGFAGGEYRKAGYFLVTNARAHAWNEVLIDGMWQRVDPTAQVPPERVDVAAREAFGENQSDFMRALRDRRDQMADWWNRTVLNFNASRQASLFKPFGVDHAGWELLVGALAGVLVSGGLVWALIIWLRDRRAVNPIQHRYLQVLKALSPLGFTRENSEAPMAFLARIELAAQTAPWLTAFVQLTQHYVQLSYAGNLDAASDQDKHIFANIAQACIAQARSSARVQTTLADQATR